LSKPSCTRRILRAGNEKLHNLVWAGQFQIQTFGLKD
jgi:hypothetical protein